MKNARLKLEQLFADFAQVTGVESPEAPAEDSPARFSAEWDGTHFEFRHDGADDDSLLVRCRLGNLPQATALEAMKRLLEIQAGLTRDERALLSLDPETDEACLTQAMSLERTGAPELVSALAVMKERAEEWRLCQFIEASPHAGLLG
jgi:hypothetical protein